MVQVIEVLVIVTFTSQCYEPPLELAMGLSTSRIVNYDYDSLTMTMIMKTMSCTAE